ncbi:MAG: hypothetical protein AVDCRST_MAG45-884, partial [uncultured Solirubrobacterales bacterium]
EHRPHTRTLWRRRDHSRRGRDGSGRARQHRARVRRGTASGRHRSRLSLGGDGHHGRRSRHPGL